jgi:hypothetical protein
MSAAVILALGRAILLMKYFLRSGGAPADGSTRSPAQEPKP